MTEKSRREIYSARTRAGIQGCTISIFNRLSVTMVNCATDASSKWCVFGFSEDIELGLSHFCQSGISPSDYTFAYDL